LKKKKKISSIWIILQKRGHLSKNEKEKVRSRPWTELRGSWTVMCWKVKVRSRPRTEPRGLRTITRQENLKWRHNLILSRTRGLCIQSWLWTWLYTKTRESYAIYCRKRNVRLQPWPFEDKRVTNLHWRSRSCI